MNVNPKNIEAMAEQKQDENFQLRMYLKWQGRLSEEELDRLVFEIAERLWATVDCTKCGNCCRDTGTLVTQSDIQRLAEGLNVSVKECTFRYLEPLEETERDEEDRVFEWMIRGRPCPFLQADNRCSVYDHRPDQCREYPHLDKPEFSSRTLGMIEKTFVCPVVYQVFEELKARFPEYKKKHPPMDSFGADWEDDDFDGEEDFEDEDDLEDLDDEDDLDDDIEDEDDLDEGDGLEDVDRTIRINELKEKANELTGGEMESWSSGDAPTEVQEAFWQNVVDIESGGWTSAWKQLQADGVSLPQPEDLTDEQLTAKLWEVIHRLAEHRTYISQTNHLSDRELYEELWHETLDEAFPDMYALSTDGGYFIDMLGSGSEEDIYLHMKYYASERERQEWAKDFPMDEMPPRETPPYDRDRLLPKHPGGW